MRRRNVRDYINRREEINIRLNEIADVAERENNRELTEDERVEVETLRREMNVLDVRIAAASRTGGMVEISDREAAFDAWLREHIASPNQHVLRREFTGLTTTGSEPMIPLTIKDVIKPLEEGLILNAVGLPLLTGLSGDYVWPVAGSIEAEVAGETVELTDKKIDFSKIKPKPERVGVTIRITNQTINQTDGVAYEIVRQQLPMGILRTLNKLMFGTDTTITHNLVGPFFKIAKGTPAALSTLTTRAKRKAASYISFAGELPTYKELIAMKSIPLLKGVEASYMAYVMDEYTKGMLEAQPIDPGSGKMTVENGKIAGIPVYCTNYINNDTDTFIGFGCWGYEPLQQFGEQRFIIDPYTGATSDVVRLTINGDWAMSTLREEAFVLGKCKASE